MNKKSLNSQFLLALGLMALLVIGNLFILETIQKQIDGLGKIINIAGRQRMLSQRITLKLLENSDADKEVELFKESQALLNQSIPKNSFLLSTEELKNHYTGPRGLNLLVNQFLKKTEILKSNSSEEDLKKFSTFTKGPLLESLDLAVHYFEDLSNHLNAFMRKVILILSLITLLGLFLIYKLILSPLRDHILENQKELKENEEKALDEAHFKSMFLANMSHELRTPLNGVLGVADLLASTPLNQEQLNYLKIINQSGETLLGVVNNILDLTKLELGQVELEKEPFSPEELFSSIEHSFQYVLLSKGLKYHLQLEKLPPALLGDKLRINQIINNLVGNAIKFTNEGSITFSAKYQNESLVLKVNDTGVGMTSAQKQNVFTPFRQADSSTTRKFGGTGLGLSIVREIIVLMGGKIVCDSQIGTGTTFTVNLPIEISERPFPQKAPLKETSFEKGKILVVDDNSVNLNLMIKILKRMNLAVKGALSGEDAIKLAREESFDIIFMDYHMPGLDGIETTLEIKKIDSAKNIPIIALTADVQDSTRAEVLKAGMVELLSKPVRRNELTQTLKTYLYKDV